MYGYFTDEQTQWISDHIEGKNWPQITEEYNSYFSSDIKPATFRYRCIRDGFVQKKKTGGIVEFTEEQDEWLKENHKQSWDSMTKQFNLIFGTSYNREKIRRHCGRYLGLTSEQTRQQYQKQLPLYSERYNAKDDLIEIKVCDEIGKCKWIPKHHYIWKLETGMKIPPDYKIIHLDGDRTNNDISNLICVSNSVMISAQKQFNWDVKNKHYRLCAIYDAQLKMLLRDQYTVFYRKELIFMTNLDWLLSDEERSKGALSDLGYFIGKYKINDWWCKHECPINDLCEPDEEFPDIRACLYEHGQDQIKVITDWFKAEHID